MLSIISIRKERSAHGRASQHLESTVLTQRNTNSPSEVLLEALKGVPPAPEHRKEMDRLQGDWRKLAWITHTTKSSASCASATRS
jgi:hypothetical protein